MPNELDGAVPADFPGKAADPDALPEEVGEESEDDEKDAEVAEDAARRGVGFGRVRTATNEPKVED